MADKEKEWWLPGERPGEYPNPNYNPKRLPVEYAENVVPLFVGIAASNTPAWWVWHVVINPVNNARWAAGLDTRPDGTKVDNPYFTKLHERVEWVKRVGEGYEVKLDDGAIWHVNDAEVAAKQGGIRMDINEQVTRVRQLKEEKASL